MTSAACSPCASELGSGTLLDFPHPAYIKGPWLHHLHLHPQSENWKLKVIPVRLWLELSSTGILARSRSFAYISIQPVHLESYPEASSRIHHIQLPLFSAVFLTLYVAEPRQNGTTACLNNGDRHWWPRGQEPSSLRDRDRSSTQRYSTLTTYLRELSGPG